MHPAHCVTQAELVQGLLQPTFGSSQVAATSADGAATLRQAIPSTHSAPSVLSPLSSSSTSPDPSGEQIPDAQQDSAAAFLDHILSQAKRGTLFKGRVPMHPPAPPTQTPAQAAVTKADRNLATAKPSSDDGTSTDAVTVECSSLDRLQVPQQPSAPEPEKQVAYAGPAIADSDLPQHQNSARHQPSPLSGSTSQELLHLLSRNPSLGPETRHVPATALGKTECSDEQESENLLVNGIGQGQAELSSVDSGFGYRSSIRETGRLLSRGSSREGDFASLLLPGCLPSRASLGRYSACCALLCLHSMSECTLAAGGSGVVSGCTFETGCIIRASEASALDSAAVACKVTMQKQAVLN